MAKLLGILGGMGPMASAEFLQSIYEFNSGDREQESPACILYSDPTFPDRTEAIFKGTEELLIDRLVEALENLCKLGASKIAIACVTLHYFLPKIPLPLQNKVVSLVDVIVEEVLKSKTRYLLLCTQGTRKAGILQKSDKWSAIEPHVVLPNEEDQAIIHDCIYKIKSYNSQQAVVDYSNYLETLLEKYQVEGFIAGCTEFHLVTKHLMKVSKEGRKPYKVIDPLLTLATNFWRFIDA